ncbi:MAG TPA: hypothetical protein VNT53_01740 [Pseudolysinimonas sp.]|nr:hypothetical protein [Pseudolysinimonas sp.]
MRRAIAAVVLIAAFIGIPTTVAAAAAPAGLSVSIGNESSDVHAGDTLAYTATVRNDGTEAVDGRLVISVPTYFRVTVAHDADRAGSDASWSVSVPPGGHVTKKLTGVLTKIPKGELRVTTLVSVYVGDETKPAVRSAEADTIAGVTDTAHSVKEEAAKRPNGLPIGWIVGGVAALALMGAAVAWWLVRRRRA